MEYLITKEDVEHFKTMRECGMTLRQIQRMLKCNTKKAKYIVNELKAQFPRTTIPNRVRCAYEEGGSVEEIAELYDLSEDCVMQYLRMYGYSFIKPTECTTTGVIADIKSGLPTRQICEKYGVSRQWVHKCKKKYLPTTIFPTTD